MVGEWTLYSSFKLGLGEKLFNLAGGGDTFVAALLSSAYGPNANTHTLWSDVSANEIAAGLGYTAGGVVLGSQALSNTVGVITWTGADLAWPTFSATFKYVALIQRAGGSLAPGDRLVAFCDMNFGGGSLTGLGGTMTIQVVTPKLLTFT